MYVHVAAAMADLIRESGEQEGRKRGLLASDAFLGTINGVILVVFLIAVIYPLYFTIAASVSDPTLVATGQITFLPRGLTLSAYQNVLENRQIWTAYANTIYYTLLGTAVSLALTIPTAFALSRPRVPGSNLILTLFLITMYFNGGLIPTYLLIRDLGMINTRWAMIVPGALSVYNLIITRSFYRSSVPEELYEAAYVDGARTFTMFWSIALPLSAPIVAVMSLYYGVGRWNQFFNALIYLSEARLYPLQLVLRNILVLNEDLIMNLDSFPDEAVEYAIRRAMLAETMKYALIFIAAAPVLMIYPFIQKYFVKGVMIGALKG
jgi:putative aldouronate transport system permease protein